IELTLFGVLAGYFAWMQIVTFRQGAVLTWAIPEYRPEFLRMAHGGNTLRWFALVVIYGIFVPNTWKRAAFFISLWCIIPVILTFVVCFGCAVMGGYITQSLLDLVTLLGIGAAIAMFGSYKISELHQQAVQARRLGQYQLKQKLGTGGMGEVYLGEHT